MSVPSREMAAAMAGTMVDQRASEHPPVSADHAPPPVYREPEATGRLSLYLGIVLVVAALVILFLL